MSIWTHVNGSIRFDSLLGRGVPTPEQLGQVCRFNDGENWEDSIIPCGSEGSIDYQIIRTGDEHSLASHVVVFIGDLRDYDNVDEITKYFTRIVKDKWIRSGIIEIEVEYNDPIILQYTKNDSGSGTWISILSPKK